MNLAEELFLCGIDEKGDSSAAGLVPGIGGAALAELALAGRIRIGNQLVLLDDAPTGDPVLDTVLGTLHEPFVAKMSPAALALSIGLQAAPLVRQSVVDSGAVVPERARRRWLGLPKRDLYVVTAHGEDPRTRLRRALAGESPPPDPRTAVLVWLAVACGLVEAPIVALEDVPEAAARAVAATQEAMEVRLSN